MKLTKTLLLLIFFSTTTLAVAQSRSDLDCKILKNVTLKYVDNADKTAYVVIQNNKHVEYLQGGKYFIKSDLDWISDCEYNAKITDITLPDFPFKAGEVMNVKFEKIENGLVSGTGSVRGKTFPVRFEIAR